MEQETKLQSNKVCEEEILARIALAPRDIDPETGLPKDSFISLRNEEGGISFLRFDYLGYDEFVVRGLERESKYNSNKKQKKYTFVGWMEGVAKDIKALAPDIIENDVEHQAIIRLARNGIIMVAGAGNDSDTFSFYPADFKEVISVAATDRDNKIADFSCYGDAKNIAAPGKDVYVLTNGGGYTTASGTSFSSPVVAMMKSVNPSLNFYDALRIICNTDIRLTDKDTVRKLKYGVIDAEKCVETAYQYDKNMSFAEEPKMEYVNVAKYGSISVTKEKRGYNSAYMIDNDEQTPGAVDVGTKQEIIIELDKSYKLDEIQILYKNNPQI